MVTPPRTPQVMETPRPRYQEATEITTGDEYYDEYEDDYDDHQEVEERLSSLNRRLRYGDAGSERSHVM